ETRRTTSRAAGRSACAPSAWRRGVSIQRPSPPPARTPCSPTSPIPPQPSPGSWTRTLAVEPRAGIGGDPAAAGGAALVGRGAGGAGGGRDRAGLGGRPPV